MYLPNSLDKLLNKIYTIAYDKESLDYVQYTKKILDHKNASNAKLLK
jgi:hypothetical protein